MECFGYLWARSGIRRAGIASVLWAGLLMNSTEQSVGSVALDALRALSAVLPSPLHPEPAVLGLLGGEKGVGLFGGVLHSGKPVLLRLSHSPHGRNHRPGRLSRHCAVLPWWRGDTGEVKRVLLPSSMCPISLFFLQQRPESSPPNSRLPKGTLAQG